MGQRYGGAIGPMDAGMWTSIGLAAQRVVARVVRRRIGGARRNRGRGRVRRTRMSRCGSGDHAPILDRFPLGHG